MNNLMIIEDNRIKTVPGLSKRIYDLCTMYHPYRTNKYYRVYDRNDKLLYKGKNRWITQEF